MKHRVHLHLPLHMFKEFDPETDSFYGKLFRGFAQHGIDLNVTRRENVTLTPEFENTDFHFVHQARITRPNVLNTGMAYLFPFWYADPRGIYADSSIRQMLFDPEAIDGSAARKFHRSLRRRLVEQRQSKYGQPVEVTNIPKKPIAIFLQGDSYPVRRARFCSEIEMVETIIAHTPEDQIVIKPHPRNDDPATLNTVRKIAKTHKNVRITHANIHDILAAARVSASISSGVSMESLLHKTPAILFGKTDFHHCAQTVRTLADYPDALAQSGTRDYPYSKFLFWFLQQNCINAGSDDFMQQIFAHMARGGYDTSALIG